MFAHSQKSKRPASRSADSHDAAHAAAVIGPDAGLRKRHLPKALRRKRGARVECALAAFFASPGIERTPARGDMNAFQRIVGEPDCAAFVHCDIRRLETAGRY